MIDTIVNSFDIWTDAQGIKSRTRVKSVDNISLEGLAGLRQLILELAMSGKLVSQDPNDEPAIVLLERIAKKNEQLFKEGKISSPKQISKISKEEEPFELPKGWEWARLPQISDYNTGRTPSTDNPAFWSNKADGLPWISISDMSDYGYISEASKYITKEASEKVFSQNPATAGTILMSFKLTIGKISILEIEAYHNEAIISIIPFEGILKEYLFKILPKRAKKGNSKNALMGNTLNAKSLALLLIPIPPFTEQKRIVTKVDELMALCDTLEAEQFNNLKTHQVLVKTLLETLTQAVDDNELQLAWERMSAHFDTLFCTEDSIDQLKQTILQLAVMGKLVKQDPNNEPASELLKKLAKEKKKLIEEGKIKKEKEFPKISKETFPFELPKGWVWCIFQEITKVITCGLASTPKYYDEGKIFLSAKNVKPFSFIPDDHKFVDEETYKKVTQNAKPELNDILITRVGAGIGETSVIDVELDFAYYVSLTLVKPFHDFVSSRFLAVWLNSPTGILNAASFTSGLGGSQGNLNVQEVRKFKVSLPPLTEQLRIVEKVDELFALCESLKEKINKSQEIKVLLSKNIVEKAVQ